jgi:hypothetical protein
VHNFVKKCGNVTLVIFISLVAFEGLAHLVIEKGAYAWQYRYLFIGRDNYRPLDGKLWTYQPNATIEIAATYRFPGWSEPKLEYYCVLKTNDLGFTKTAHDEKVQIDYLVMGDSYTEGHGGCSWLNDTSTASLRNTYLNAGAQSYGIWQMDETRKYLEQHKDFANLIVFAISDDFVRPLRNEWIVEHRACLKEFNCEFGKTAWWVTNDFSEENLFEITRHWHAHRHQGEAYWDKLDFYANRYSFFYEIVQKIFAQQDSANNNHGVSRADEGGVFRENLEALHRMRAAYPKMKLILVPQRDELRFGLKNKVTLALLDYLDSDDFDYHWCELTPKDFMPIDGHPSKRGYQTMLECMTDLTEPQ